MSVTDAVQATDTAVPSGLTPQVPLEFFFQPKPGLLVTAELEKAIEECKDNVARIVKECRAKNRKFRDIEFDLENDQYRCLHGLELPIAGRYVPSDVQRVTQIFEKPQFFVDGADSNDIIQGKLGDCWFLSALATVSTAKGLVEKFCVARNEEVGVYGFIFFRDNSWVNIVIDDMLYTSVPKYEELSVAEKELYQEDKASYNSSARKGGKTLYFAKSGTTGETWVPLIEKAYAKLHGDYVSLSGGKSLEAVEDLTGFWSEELLKANQDRLFGCSFDSLDSSRNGIRDAKVDGLIGSHAYSVLRAVECKGKRFLVLRNPWGRSEWTGRWSDGSKEWTPAWLEILPLLDHEFGDDGQFVMEYCDFLEVWDQIHRTILFDSSWIMSSQWLQVPVRPSPSAWSHGDVVFTFSLQERALTIIVLSQLDTRYFKEIAGASSWTLDFVLVKRGESVPMAESSSSLLFSRSVNLEMELDEGEYNVYARLDRTTFKDPDYFKKGVESGWDHRKLSRILTERTKSRSVVSNFKPGIQQNYLPTDLSALIIRDLILYERKKAIELAKKQEQEEDVKAVTVTVTSTTTTTTTTILKENVEEPTASLTSPNTAMITATTIGPINSTNGTVPPPQPDQASSFITAPPSNTPRLPQVDTCLIDPGHISNFIGNFRSVSPKFRSFSTLSPVPRVTAPEKPVPSIEIAEDDDLLYLGLRVYTKNTIAVVSGLLCGDIPGLDLSPSGTRPSTPTPMTAK